MGWDLKNVLSRFVPVMTKKKSHDLRRNMKDEGSPAMLFLIMGTDFFVLQEGDQISDHKNINAWEFRCKQPTRCNKFRLLIFLNQLYMFRATNSPILRSTTVHRYCCRPSVGSNIGALYQKLYMQSKSAPENWRVCCPKHVELI